MSERRTHAAAAASGSPAFSDLWRSVSKLCRNKTQDNNTGKQACDTPTPAPVMCKDLQSPQRPGWSRYPGLNNGDSPGDVEATQDIIWDPTSPTNPGQGLRNTRVVEISDIVNRIAPKDLKPRGSESPLLQWIGDVPCTPEVPRPRVRKKSSWHSSAKDLLKLARQFDENMQQDKETSEEQNTVNNNHNERLTASSSKLAEVSLPASDHVEAELRALFDSSTQKVSGQLSQGSFRSSCSPERSERPLIPAEPQRSNLKSADKSGSTAHPAEEKETCGSSANNCDDFDDDWEDDELLNDPFVLAMTQNSDEQHDTNLKPPAEADTKTNTKQCLAACKPPASLYSSRHVTDLQSKPSCSVLQKLCPKTKTTNRSTFKLEPNPHFQPFKGFTAIQSKSHTSEQNCAKKPGTLQPGKSTNDHKGPDVAADSVKDISDSLWDDGDDDALFYQVCDTVERISNSQPLQVSPVNPQAKQDVAPDRLALAKTSAPLPIDNAWSMNAGANRQAPCAFVRSNSLPGTNCEALNHQGWNVPMRGNSSKSAMSQSLPGSRVSLGTFSRCRDSSGASASAAADANVDVKPVTAGPPQDSKSHHTAVKRNVADAAAVSNKVFVTSKMTAKCSAAEIEKKKRDALARRRLRMQNTPKP